MFEGFLELLFSFVLDFLVEVIGPILLNGGAEAIGKVLRRPRHRRRLIEICIVILSGAALGASSVALFPTRLLPSPGSLFFSMILAPVAAGFIMMHMGTLKRRRGGRPAFLATFRGGALCALAIALMRFLVVSR